MNPISTGDPTLDGLLQWITAGGSLTSPGAMFGLAVIIHMIAMPLMDKLAQNRGWNFSGTNATWGVFGSSLALVMGIGAYTHTMKSFNESIPLSMQVALAAMGIHATRKASSATTPATVLPTVDDAMPPIPPGQPE